MKKIILLVLLACPVLLFGQVKFSNEFSITTSGTPYTDVPDRLREYFSDGKGKVISFKTLDEKITLQLFDSETMKELNKKEYTDFPKDFRQEKILKTSDKLFYFYSAPNKSKGTSIYYREVDLTNGTFLPTKLLFDVTGKVTFFQFLESLDKTKLLIDYRRAPVNKNDELNYDVLGFYSFNMALEKNAGAEIKMPYTEKIMKNVAFAIGNSGTIYMLSLLTNDSHYELSEITGNSISKTSKLNLDTSFTKLEYQELRLTEHTDGNLVCIGYYNSVRERKMSVGGSVGIGAGANSSTISSTSVLPVNGILRFKFSLTGNIIEKNTYPFSLSLINQYESERAQRANTKEAVKVNKSAIDDLKLLHVLNDETGTVIIGEQTYFRFQKTPDGFPQIQFYKSDVVMTKIDITGKLLWMIKLPKTQIGIMGTYSIGMKYIPNGAYSYVVFMDNKKNVDITKESTPHDYIDGFEGYLSAYKINMSSGDYSRQTIVDIKDINGLSIHKLSVSEMVNVSDRAYLLEGEVKQKNNLLLKLQLR